MKAIVIHRYGPPDVLRFESVPDPEPRAGEVRIAIAAATVNRVLDVSLRAGKEGFRGATLPLIPGVDCAGVIDAVGAGVTRWRPGMRVAAAGIMPLEVCAEDGSGYAGPTGMMGIKRPGGFAEKVAVPACAAVALPDALDFHHAAVVMRHVPTAWNLLFNVAQLKPSETVLVMGAGGNLGSIGIQLAKNVIGARVIAAAGSEERAQLGRELGADLSIDYSKADLHAEVMKFTGGKGVDVLYDNIANPNILPVAFRTIGMHGRLVTAGAHARPERQHRLLASLSPADHHQGPARLPAGGSAEMLRGGGRRKGAGADRARAAALARRRGAPADRIGRGFGQDRARPDAELAPRTLAIPESAPHTRRDPAAPRCHDRNFRPLLPWGSAPIFRPFQSSPMTSASFERASEAKRRFCPCPMPR